MNEVIYKYPLDICEVQHVTMKKFATILCVKVQNNAPCLYALVNTDAPDERREILTFGTGQPMTDMKDDVTRAVLQRRYIDTCQLVEGRLVLHFFEHVLRDD